MIQQNVFFFLWVTAMVFFSLPLVVLGSDCSNLESSHLTHIFIDPLVIVNIWWWPLYMPLESVHACVWGFTQGERGALVRKSPPNSWLLGPVMRNYDRKERSYWSYFKVTLVGFTAYRMGKVIVITFTIWGLEFNLFIVDLLVLGTLLLW